VQTIHTKYHGAAGNKPARISAQASGWGKRIYLSADQFPQGDGHAEAAAELQKRLKIECPHGRWDGPMVGGQLADGSWVWVFDHPNSPRTAARPVFSDCTLAEASLAFAGIMDNAGPKDIRGARTVLRGMLSDVRHSRYVRKCAAILEAALGELK
jgi:hypothetical protein